MKRNITLAAAFALAFASTTVFAETTAEAIAEPAEAPVEAPAPAEAAPAPTVEIPADIQSHLDARFPGSTVNGITREGCTYVVELGSGQHIRYDNCCNPICYGDHTHE